jgi:hypothetical protein
MVPTRAPRELLHMEVTHMLSKVILTREAIFPLSGALPLRTVEPLRLRAVMGIVVAF